MRALIAPLVFSLGLLVTVGLLGTVAQAAPHSPVGACAVVHVAAALPPSEIQ